MRTAQIRKREEGSNRSESKLIDFLQSLKHEKITELDGKRILQIIKDYVFDEYEEDVGDIGDLALKLSPALLSVPIFQVSNGPRTFNLREHREHRRAIKRVQYLKRESNETKETKGPVEIRRYGKYWAVWFDGKLLAVVVYKKGAEAITTLIGDLQDRVERKEMVKKIEQYEPWLRREEDMRGLVGMTGAA